MIPQRIQPPAAEPPSAEAIAHRLARIPRRYRGASWANLTDLRTDGGELRVKLSRQGIEAARNLLRAGSRAVFVGPSGAGKSTMAAAHLRERIEAGIDRVRWFDAAELLADEPIEVGDQGRTALPTQLAIVADVLVLDDLGAELEQAPAGSGLLAQRVGACSRVLAKRFDAERPTLVTTGLSREQVVQLYGDRIARRVFEGAAVVRLG